MKAGTMMAIPEWLCTYRVRSLGHGPPGIPSPPQQRKGMRHLKVWTASSISILRRQIQTLRRVMPAIMQVRS